MSERHREHTILPFGSLHLGNDCLHRLDRRAPHVDHTTIMDSHYWFDLTKMGTAADFEKFFGAGTNVDMGILFEQDDRVSAVGDCRRDGAMQIQLNADSDIRTNDLTHSGQDVAFAVLVALCGHRPVHRQQDNVQRHRRP